MADEKKFDQKDIDENKVLAAIGYLCILFLVPLFAAKSSPFAQFHAKQGLVLFVVWVIVWVVTLIPILGWIIGFFGTILLAVVSLIALIKALQGEAWEIPFVADFAKQLKI
ncbi:MAG: DUF4870 domain-containing protein [Patescibacteria group bacterium]|nr:DUF4870 domain-containing protein [Patescibacteria group bacterium]